MRIKRKIYTILTYIVISAFILSVIGCTQRVRGFGNNYSPSKKGQKVSTKNVSFPELGFEAIHKETKIYKNNSIWYDKIELFIVNNIDPVGPVAKAGLRSGDIIFSVNNESPFMRGIKSSWKKTRLGDTLTLGIGFDEKEGRIGLVNVRRMNYGSKKPLMHIPRTVNEMIAFRGGVNKVVARLKKYSPRSHGAKKLKYTDLVRLMNKTLSYTAYPSQAKGDVYISTEGSFGAGNMEGNYQRVCGVWEIRGSQICWDYLAVGQPRPCYQAYKHLDGKIVLDNVQSKTEAFMLIDKISLGDSRGLARASQNKVRAILSDIQMEYVRGQELADAHSYCSRTSYTNKYNSYANPYDTCMSEAGYPDGLFNVLSMRTKIGLGETMVFGFSSKTACMF